MSHLFYLCSAGKCKEIRFVVGRHHSLFPFLPPSPLLTRILLDGYRKGHCLRRGHRALLAQKAPVGTAKIPQIMLHGLQFLWRQGEHHGHLLHAGILTPGTVSQPEWAAKEKCLLNEWKQYMKCNSKARISFPQSGSWYLMVSLMCLSCALHIRQEHLRKCCPVFPAVGPIIS